jgi:hypothetical protein
MRLNVGQESNARRSPYPGGGLYGQGIAEEGNHYGAEYAYRRLEDRNLQHAARLAFLARLARFAMLRRAFHVVTAVHSHVVHHRHAHRLHWARFCRRLNTRHPAKGKRQANHENEAKPQVAFHGLECSG